MNSVRTILVLSYDEISFCELCVHAATVQAAAELIETQDLSTMQNSEPKKAKSRPPEKSSALASELEAALVPGPSPDNEVGDELEGDDQDDPLNRSVSEVVDDLEGVDYHNQFI
jgi:hypothetical protein